MRAPVGIRPRAEHRTVQKRSGQEESRLLHAGLLCKALEPVNSLFAWRSESPEQPVEHSGRVLPSRRIATVDWPRRLSESEHVYRDRAPGVRRRALGRTPRRRRISSVMCEWLAKPQASATCAIGTPGSWRRAATAASMRRVCTYWCGVVPYVALNRRAKCCGLSPTSCARRFSVSLA